MGTTTQQQPQSDVLQLLLVEDNSNDAALIRRALATAGFQLESTRVETAAIDGDSAVTILRAGMLSSLERHLARVSESPRTSKVEWCS